MPDEGREAAYEPTHWPPVDRLETDGEHGYRWRCQWPRCDHRWRFESAPKIAADNLAEHYRRAHLGQQMPAPREAATV